MGIVNSHNHGLLATAEVTPVARTMPMVVRWKDTWPTIKSNNPSSPNPPMVVQTSRVNREKESGRKRESHVPKPKAETATRTFPAIAFSAISHIGQRPLTASIRCFTELEPRMRTAKNTMTVNNIQTSASAAISLSFFESLADSFTPFRSDTIISPNSFRTLYCL